MPVTNLEVKVKEYFDNTDMYLSENDGITVRQETIRDFLINQSFQDVLDIACGNGMVSIPLLDDNVNLTLLDISENMLQIARSHVPQKWNERVRTITSNIHDADIADSSYDVVLCLGLLAHLPNPIQTVERLLHWVRPKGHLIIQNTDAAHPYSWFVLNFLDSMKTWMGFKSYRLTLVSEKKLKNFLSHHGFKLMGSYSYTISFPLVHRFLTHGRMLRFIRFIFGNVERKRNQWLGNDSIMHFIKQD